MDADHQPIGGIDLLESRNLFGGLWTVETSLPGKLFNEHVSPNGGRRNVYPSTIGSHIVTADQQNDERKKRGNEDSFA